MARPKCSMMVACALAGTISATALAAPPRKEIVPNGNSLDVFIHTGRITTLEFSSVIVRAMRPAWQGLDYHQTSTTITLHPKVLPESMSVLGGFNVTLQEGTITINLRPAKDLDAADRIVQITTLQQFQTWRSAIEDGTQGTRAAVKETEIAILRGLHDALVGREVTSAFLREMLSEYERHPIEPRIGEEYRETAGAPPTVQATAWYRSPQHLLLGYDIYNPHEVEPLYVKRLAVLGESGTRDHAGEAFLGGPTDGQYLAVIPPRTKVSGLVFVREPYDAGATVSLKVVPAAPASMPIMQTRIPVIDLSPPKTPEEIRDDKARGMVALQLKVLGGVILLPSGLDGVDQLGTTSVKGLGVRVTYGFNRYLSLEVEAIGATTGTATFEDVMFEGQAGDLRRGAVLGRGQFGAVLGFGDTIVPSLRIGAGAQGVSHDSELAADAGGTMAGPDFAFDFSFLFYAGVGVDFHLSESFVANLGISVENPISSDARTFEAGLNVGYRWRP